MPSVNLTRERSLYQAFSEHAVKTRQTELAQIQEQLATNRRVNRASDDPSAYGRARQLEALGERHTQYQRSITSARAWVDTSQAALGQLGELFTQVYEEGVRFANGTHSAEDRQTGVRAMESLLGAITEQLNTRLGDEFVFAGSRTAAPPPPAPQTPFTLTGTTLAYHGNDADRMRQLGRDLTMPINVTGQDLFTVSTAPPLTLSDVMNNLMTAVGTGDPAQLDAALADAQRARDHVVDLTGAAGNTGSRLQLAERQLADAALLVEAERGAVEDIDLADVLMRQQRAQTGLQASLTVASSLLRTSILDYLR